jgi:serine-type D-Ala-D-Ala carboxypeptidase
VSQIPSILRRHIESRVFPGCAYAYGNGERWESGTLGHFTYEPGSPSVGRDSLWDLASLTKIVATTPVLMRLVEGGRMGLEQDIQEILPKFPGEGVSIQALLTHRSGLPPYEPFHLSCRTREECEERLFAMPVAPVGSRETAYSCLGFMFLQRAAEAVTGLPFRDLVQDYVLTPLKMDSACFCPSIGRRALCVPTETSPAWRSELTGETPGAPLQGVVHDPAAFMMGGVSGNAGLFADITDMIRFAHALLTYTKPFPAALALSQWTVQCAKDSSRGLGFDTKQTEPSRGGPQWPPSTFGHTGYTGTSLWVSRNPNVFAVLLTNRVHPDDSPSMIAQARTDFGQAVWTEVTAWV